MSSSRFRSARRPGAIRLLRAAGTLVCLGVAAGCARSAASPGVASPIARPPAILDPSEEITPEELSTIPEPVPRAQGGGSGVQRRGPLPVAQAAPQGDSGGTETDSRRDGPLWRVQVFATQDRTLADRMAGETAALLHASAHVAYEAPVYKVRLGDYGSEEAAGSLRDRAVQSGFPGAFRIRCAREASHNLD